MTNKPKQTQPKQVPRILHIGVRETYGWEEPDFTTEETGGDALKLMCLLNTTKEPPQWAGSTSHLYSEPLQIPIPSFDPVSKQLEAIDNELGEIRRQFYQRKDELESKRQRILALTGPSDDDGYIPREED